MICGGQSDLRSDSASHWTEASVLTMRETSVINNLTEQLLHCKVRKNIITKHEQNLLHDIKGYNWILQKKNSSSSQCSLFVHMTHRQPKQADGYFWYLEMLFQPLEFPGIVIEPLVVFLAKGLVTNKELQI